MKALASAIGGVCILDNGTPEQRFVNVADLSEIPPAIAHLAYGVCDDWEEIEGTDREVLVREVQDRHACLHATANIEVCLIGVSAELEAAILLEVEDYLKTHDARQLKASLLRAPLVSTTELQRVIRICLAEGLASTGVLLEDVRESQPFLWRLTDKWLRLPHEYFAAFAGGRQQIWQMAVTSGFVVETMGAATIRDVKAKWGQLAFSFPTQRERAGIARIATAIAHALFPGQAEPRQPQTLDAESSESASDDRRALPRGQQARDSHERALKQVQAIADAVGAGQDAKASRFLRDLINEQMSFRGGQEYAAKSLCNIAKQCADMFRTDFEYECLEKAVSINTEDGWTRVQLADHYKRIGRFDDAIAVLRKAESLGENVVAKSSLADVYARMGRFPEAIEIYKTIPGGEQDASIRTAQADLLRRSGSLDAAAKEYDRIVRDGLTSHRVVAGRAEIAKRQGSLVEARDSYRGLLDSTDLDDKAIYIYRMSLANVLVRMGEYKEAYNYADDAVQTCPFSMQARAVRAAIVGLLGDPASVVEDLPMVGQTRAFNEWISDFVRGVLLLMLDRYADARQALLRQVEDRFADTEGHGLLCLGAAVCLLRNRAGLEEASKILDRIPEMNDAFADSIRDALQYHVAVAMRDKAQMTRLEEQLSSVEDIGLRELITALGHKDWKNACRLEVQTVLRLAS